MSLDRLVDEEALGPHVWKLQPSQMTRLREVYHQHHELVNSFWGVYDLVHDCSISISPPLLEDSLRRVGVFPRSGGDHDNNDELFVSEQQFLLLVEDLMCDDRHRDIYFEDDKKLLEIALCQQQAAGGSAQPFLPAADSEGGEGAKGTGRPTATGINIPLASLTGVLQQYRIDNVRNSAVAGGAADVHLFAPTGPNSKPAPAAAFVKVMLSEMRAQEVAHNNAIKAAAALPAFLQTRKSVTAAAEVQPAAATVPVDEAEVLQKPQPTSILLDVLCQTLNRKRLATPDPLLDFRPVAVDDVGCSTSKQHRPSLAGVVQLQRRMTLSHDAACSPNSHAATRRSPNASSLATADQLGSPPHFLLTAAGSPGAQVRRQGNPTAVGGLRRHDSLENLLQSTLFECRHATASAIRSASKDDGELFEDEDDETILLTLPLLENGPAMSPLKRHKTKKLPPLYRKVHDHDSPQRCSSLHLSACTPRAESPRAYRKPWTEGPLPSPSSQLVERSVLKDDELKRTKESHRLPMDVLLTEIDGLSPAERRALTPCTRRLVSIAAKVRTIHEDAATTSKKKKAASLRGSTKGRSCADTSTVLPLAEESRRSLSVELKCASEDVQDNERQRAAAESQMNRWLTTGPVSSKKK